MEQRYRLVGDDSGHKYVIPVEKAEEWYAMLEHGEETGEYQEFAWAQRVEGALSFLDPQID